MHWIMYLGTKTVEVLDPDIKGFHHGSSATEAQNNKKLTIGACILRLLVLQSLETTVPEC